MLVLMMLMSAEEQSSVRASVEGIGRTLQAALAGAVAADTSGTCVNLMLLSRRLGWFSFTPRTSCASAGVDDADLS